MSPALVFVAVLCDTSSPALAFASSTPMTASQGGALAHPVTEVEAVRSILVQGLPLLDQELTESSIVQVRVQHMLRHAIFYWL